MIYCNKRPLLMSRLCVKLQMYIDVILIDITKLQESGPGGMLWGPKLKLVLISSKGNSINFEQIKHSLLHFRNIITNYR